ncbi:MAG TPA: DUF3857 domain-containing transglutaminase family protein [Steroidobacteraceae bacterium]|nr:DUF3857 domain-containing transglutaminase family protein [Steroidobacteraceae bacterium]
MRDYRFLICAIALVLAPQSNAGNAGNRDIQYTEAPSWVIPFPTPTDSPTPDGAPFRVVYSDNQIRLGPNGFEAYQAYRMKILKPDALSAGNISVSWSPDAGDAKVHYLRIIRGTEVIDVLKTTKFQVLQREGFLEQAALNGQLTATLQSPGLQVGDELEFAATVRTKDPTLGDHLFGFAQLPATGLPGAFRMRVVWPKTSNIHWRASPDVSGVTPTTVNGQVELLYELRDPHSAVIADGAPARVNVRRFLEVSDFDSWTDVSRRIWPLFDKAAVLARNSPVRAEITQIASAQSDPVKRMAAALKLVQDRIRYVYVGLNGGNLTPATADQTWERKFGDCKAKTALLLAVLRELGIRGEPVLVNSAGGDGINERLPTPGFFDHVVVRVNLENKVYWLDGTRLGDSTLEPPLTLRWVLPLRPAGSDLESVPSKPPRSPDAILVLDVDSNKGFDQKAAIKVQEILRGDGARSAAFRIKAMSAEDADKAVKAYWRQNDGWIEQDTSAWNYDEQQGLLVLILTGHGKVDWTGDDADGRSLNIYGAGFTPPNEYHRPKEQDQMAPWMTDYPTYHCWVTAIHLPRGGSEWKWDYDSDPVDTEMGGVHYWRIADLREGVMRTVMSRKVELPEITAVQAEELNQQLPKFNNNMSRVYQVASSTGASTHKSSAPAPFNADTDWTRPDTACGAN